VIDRFLQLPASLAERSRVVRLAGRLGPIPALLCHPDWVAAAPMVLWLHGRTAYKELDSGRFLRLVRAGIGVVAIDAPGHGERKDARGEEAGASLSVMRELLPEVDEVVEALADPVWQGVFDLDRMGIGGMSLGGMTTLRRLCDGHGFRCASVESACGDLAGLYDPERGTRPWGTTFPAAEIGPLDPMGHLVGFAPLPILALHSEADRIVPWAVQRGFLERLGQHYVQRGADPGMIEVKTWATTGAPEEHSGFGKVAGEAKTVQLEFFTRWLRPGG